MGVPGPSATAVGAATGPGVRVGVSEGEGVGVGVAVGVAVALGVGEGVGDISTTSVPPFFELPSVQRMAAMAKKKDDRDPDRENERRRQRAFRSERFQRRTTFGAAEFLGNDGNLFVSVS